MNSQSLHGSKYFNELSDEEYMALVEEALFKSKKKRKSDAFFLNLRRFFYIGFALIAAYSLGRGGF